MGYLVWAKRLLFSVLILSFGCSHASAALKAHSWQEVSYELKPFSQESISNLVPPITTDMSASRFGQDLRLVKYEGKTCVLLDAADPKHKPCILFSVPARAHRLYCVRFEYQCVDCDYDGKTLFSGLIGSVAVYTDKKHKITCLNIHQRHKTTGWVVYECEFFTDVGGKLAFKLALEAKAGRAYVRNIKIFAPSVPLSEGRSQISAQGGVYAEAPRKVTPSAPARTVAFGCDPDNVFPYSSPHNDEVSRPIRLSGAQGDTLVAALAVRPSAPLRALRLDTTAAQQQLGKAAMLGWRIVKFHPRLNHYSGKGKTFQFVPNFFLNRPKGTEAPANRTTAFWLTLRIAADAAPGERRLKIRVLAEGFEVEQILHLRVWPFRLADDDGRARMLYPDEGRWDSMTDDRVSAELSDFQAHGFTGLLLKHPGTFTLTGGRVTGWTFNDSMTRTMRLVRQAGLNGPFVISFVPQPNALARAMGVKPEHIHKLKKKQYPVEDPMAKWPRDVWEGYREMLKQADAAWRRQGWGQMIFFGMDEPKAQRKGHVKAFEWIYGAARAADVSTFCTVSALPSDSFTRQLTHPCYWGNVFKSRERTAEIVTETRETGRNPWYYSSGCYAGQVGRMAPNRWETGFKFYLSDADGTVSWTFQRPISNAFDDFIASHGQYCTVYPDPEHPGQYLDTPSWEGLRQGWLDYRYCVTLEKKLAEAKLDLRKRDKSLRIAKNFNRLLHALPWENGFMARPALSNQHLQQCRLQIAEWIFELTN